MKRLTKKNRLIIYKRALEILIPTEEYIKDGEYYICSAIDSALDNNYLNKNYHDMYLEDRFNFIEDKFPEFVKHKPKKLNKTKEEESGWFGIPCDYSQKKRVELLEKVIKDMEK